VRPILVWCRCFRFVHCGDPFGTHRWGMLVIPSCLEISTWSAVRRPVLSKEQSLCQGQVLDLGGGHALVRGVDQAGRLRAAASVNAGGRDDFEKRQFVAVATSGGGRPVSFALQRRSERRVVMTIRHLTGSPGRSRVAL
jgi:hypothetical protein